MRITYIEKTHLICKTVQTRCIHLRPALCLHIIIIVSIGRTLLYVSTCPKTGGLQFQTRRLKHLYLYLNVSPPRTAPWQTYTYKRTLRKVCESARQRGRVHRTLLLWDPSTGGSHSSAGRRYHVKIQKKKKGRAL